MAAAFTFGWLITYRIYGLATLTANLCGPQLGNVTPHYRLTAGGRGHPANPSLTMNLIASQGHLTDATMPLNLLRASRYPTLRKSTRSTKRTRSFPNVCVGISVQRQTVSITY